MTDEREPIRAFSQDRQTQQQRKPSTNASLPTTVSPQSKVPYASRRAPDIVTLISLSNQRFEDYGKQIYQSVPNDRHNFHSLNYPLRSPSLTPLQTFPSVENIPDSKQPTLPNLTPRTSRNPKKFPSLTSNSYLSINQRKTPKPGAEGSTHTRSVPTREKVPSKMPMVSTERKKKIQLPEHLRCPE